MGSFNVVTTSVRCPKCESNVSARVQFKFGDTSQYEYAVGDALRWGGNDVGSRGLKHVVVDGVAEEACPACGFGDEWSFDVHLENDVIASAVPATGAHDFVKARSTFIVLIS